MPSINKVFLMGHLTRDPELRYTPNGMPVADFGIATNRKYKDKGGESKEEATFVDLVAFGKRAETIGTYLKKGRLLYVEGRLRYESWESKDGQKRSRMRVVVENFQFMDWKEKEEVSATEEKEEDFPFA